MSIISKIDELIANPYKVTNRINGKIHLIEENESEFPATILKNPSKLLICKFDDNKNLFPYFSDIPKAKSMSDYICFIEYDNNLFVLIIELSMTKPKTYQFEPTKIFSDYIIKTCKRLFKTEFDIIYKNVLITKNVHKNSTKVKPSKYYYLKAGSEIDLITLCTI